MKDQTPGRCTSVRFFLCLNHTVSQHLTCVAWCQIDLHVSLCRCRMLTTDVVTNYWVCPSSGLLQEKQHHWDLSWRHSYTHGHPKPQIFPSAPLCMEQLQRAPKKHSHLQIYSSAASQSLSSEITEQVQSKVFSTKGKEKTNPFFASHVQATITRLLYRQQGCQGFALGNM